MTGAGARKSSTFSTSFPSFFRPARGSSPKSVRNYRHRVADPLLGERADRFIYQEAMHAKEHTRCNAAVSQAFPAGHRIEKFVAGWLSWVRRVHSKAAQLTCTCALEHFTAAFADTILRNQEQFAAECDPDFAALWLWHAVEETEHKAICFDVYRQVVGKGPFACLYRVGWMVICSIAFLVCLSVSALLLKGRSGARGGAAEMATPPAGAVSPDRTEIQHATGAMSFWQVLTKQISLKLYFDYYRPSFHPDDHDNRHLVEQWKRRYPGFGAGPDSEVDAVVA